MEDGEPDRDALYRLLPSVDELLGRRELRDVLRMHSRALVTGAARSVLRRARREIAERVHTEQAVRHLLHGVAEAVAEETERTLRPTLVPVINATGVILHTNLGRAPLSQAAIRAVSEVARGYSNLEFDLATGSRGRRDRHAGPLLLRALGAIAGECPERVGQGWGVVVVNNCAAATFLAINSLAEGGEVLVSRGELVEIGGGFRIPEILHKAGVILREVGTTNRTRLTDYESAVNGNTRMILRVHQSNFKMEGFTERPELEELIRLGRTAGLAVFEDQGTGLMIPLREVGVSGEPSLIESFRKGPDLTAASGDKLLGGPQCGLLLGRSDLVERIRANPLFRALRVDKLTYAALEATLLGYVAGREEEIPTVRMLRIPAEVLTRRCQAVRDALGMDDLDAAVVPAHSVIGGGTTAGLTLDSFALSLRHRFQTPKAFMERLRRQTPPVIARVQNDCVLLDLRTVAPEQDQVLIGLVRAAAGGVEE